MERGSGKAVKYWNGGRVFKRGELKFWVAKAISGEL